MREAAGQPSGALRCSRRATWHDGNAEKFVFAPRGKRIWKRLSAGGCDPSGLAIVTDVPRPIAHGRPGGWSSSVAAIVSLAVGAAGAPAGAAGGPAARPPGRGGRARPRPTPPTPCAAGAGGEGGGGA